MTTTTTALKIPAYKAELVRQIRAHAVQNYTKGWDEIVEAWTDDNIRTVFGRAYTLASCLKRIKAELDVRRALFAEWN
jgi:hypothetical protein